MQRDQIPWGPAAVAAATLVLHSLTIAAAVGSGYLKAEQQLLGQQDFGLFDKISGARQDLLGHLRAAQAFAVLSMLAFLPPLALSFLDFRNGAVSMWCAISLFVPAVFILMTWILEVTLFTRPFHGFRMSSFATLSWGFAILVANSVLTALLAGLTLFVAMGKGRRDMGYMPHGGLVQAAVPLQQQGYFPPQMQPQPAAANVVNTYPQQAELPVAVHQQGVPVQPVGQAPTHHQPVKVMPQQGAELAE